MSTEPTPKPRAHHFVQAPVRPLDPDGVVVGIIGTIGWALLTIIFTINLDWLDATAHRWWLWTALSGTVLGVIGTGYCLRRRHRRLR